MSNKYTNYNCLKKHLFIILFFITIKLFSQDAFFGISSSAYLYNNPANAGISGDLRCNNVFKNQFSILSGNYNTNFLSVDYNKNNQGLGLYFLADQSGTASVSKLELAGIYSYLTQISDKVGFSFGIGVGGGQSRLNFNSAIFEDQLQSDFSTSPNTLEDASNSNNIYIDINSGVMLFTDNFWIGLASHHLNKPTIYSIGNEARLSRKYGVQAGYVFYFLPKGVINKNVKNKNQINYALNSTWQGKLWRTSVGGKLFYNNIIGNLSFSNINIKEIKVKGMLIGAGVNYEMISFVYGYEFYLGNRLKVGGAHEIQIQINLFHDNKINNYTFKNKKSLKTFCPLK